ncbi:MAG: hypothetical protein M0P43_02325 [Arcobacteraceae bacterium]|nr:hypothetical protein [Arcobacteraceae bacterium]MDY0328715.1 hypothetical protein [Arcobacteraceae bacterium]
MIIINDFTIKNNENKYNLANRYKPNISKNFIKKILCIILFIFVGLNIFVYTIEYKHYVANAPQHLKEARKEFLHAYMFHMYYGYTVNYIHLDYQNKILKIFKVPRDFFYKRALIKLPDNEAEKALWFNLFEVLPYNLSVRGKYGSMAKHYGVDFANNFVEQLYNNLHILSTQKIDSSYTKYISRDIIEAYLGMMTIFKSEAHLDLEGFIFGDNNMKKYSTDKDLHDKFVEIYYWQEKFFSFYKDNYPQEYQYLFSEDKGWYSPYITFYDNLLTLSSFILFYKIKNNQFECEKDKKYLHQIDNARSTLLKYATKHNVSNTNIINLKYKISYLSIKNNAKGSLFYTGDNPLKLEINCRYK